VLKTDIAQVYSKFIGPLPLSMKEFALDVNRIFPHIADTRHLMSQSSSSESDEAEEQVTVFSILLVVPSILYIP
jgi:hypothetical protein